jgi:hypothetical protein
MSDDKAWQRILEIARENDLPVNLSRNLENLINSRKDLTKKLSDFSKDIRAQEIAVNSVKSVGVGTTALGASLMFTPFFPLGAGVIVGSSAGLALTDLGDWIAENIKEGKLDRMLEEDKKLAELLINDMKQMDVLCEAFLREKLIPSKEEGYGLAITIVIGVSKFGNKALSAIALWKPFKDLWKNGMRYSTERVASNELKKSLGFISRSAAVFTVVVAVADCIICWLSTKPCRATADKAKKAIDDSMPHLVELKKVVDHVEKHSALGG